MSGAGWLNIGSLILGLIAWILPIVGLAQRKGTGGRNRAVFSTTSVSACAVSLCMQLFYSDHLVQIEDWSALLDTSHAVAWVSAVLLIVTIALNAILLIVYRERRETGDS